jgi:hypothetical protein
MATVMPAQIQQQFQSIIRFLGKDVGQEATRAYLRSLYVEASLNMLLRRKRRGKSALKRQHVITSSQRDGSDDPNGLNTSPPTRTYTGLSLPPQSNTPKEDIPPMISSENIPSPGRRLSLSNPETPVLSSVPLSAEKTSLTLC